MHFGLYNYNKLHTPLTITSAVCEYEMTGSPGTRRLPLHVYLHLPAAVAYTESWLVLAEFSRPLLVIFVLVPSWFKDCTTSKGEVCLQEIVFGMVTVDG